MRHLTEHNLRMTSELTAEAIEQADRVCALSLRILRALRPQASDLLSVLMVAHAVRMLRFVQGAAQLARAGNMEPACVLARTVLEMGWIMLSIQADPARLSEWAAQANGEARKSLRRLKDLGEHERSPTLSDEHIDAAIAGMPSGKNFNLKDWAHASGAPQAYSTIYQQLSSCAHAEMPATLNFIRFDPVTDQPVRVLIPDLEELPADALNVCTAVLLDALRYVSGSTLTGDELREVEDLERDRRTLMAKIDEMRMRSLDSHD